MTGWPLLRTVLLIAGLGTSATAAGAQSVYTSRPDDPQAVYLTEDEFGVRGDSQADDTAGIQAALDKASRSFAGGLVFVPAGRYRVTRTLYVWRGVRVIGYGPTRPTFLLADNTPGFQQGIGLMVMFTSGMAPAEGRPRPPGPVAFPPPGQVPSTGVVADANQGTFYSGMANLDFEIGEGNPAAVAIRFHVAQHGTLSDMDFRIGSGLAALTEIGNEVERLRFFGGRYGILTDNTSPYWPFTILDSMFDGQREAAIREHLAWLTVVRTTFRNVPTAIEIDRGYPDRLWVKDSRFENVSRAAIVVSNERNATTQIGVENATCANVPVFARFRESGRAEAGAGPIYSVRNFAYGLVVPAAGGTGQIDSSYRAEPLASLPPHPPPVIRALPPMHEWVNVHTLGVKGDGVTDDTAAIHAAIAAHRVLYFPSGHYIVRDTITLGRDTVLIALHPGLTQLDLPDSTPGFQGAGPPLALLEAPPGADAVVWSLGIFTGGINPRAVGVLWKAGETSLMYDVHFHGFAGTYLPQHVRDAHYKGTGRGGPVAPAGRWGAQYPSLWVTGGGGGTFAAVWSPNTFARNALYISDTTTPGRVYGLSAEHHLFNEIKLERVENWEFHAPQTEEESSTSPEAVAFEISDSKNITIANFHAYRVTRSHAPFPAAVRIYNSSGIRFRNVHVNAEHGYGVCDDTGCDTFLRAGKFPYDNAIQDVTRRVEVREREFAVFDVTGGKVEAPAPDRSPVLAPGATVERLEGGFHAISGAAVDAKGTLYFVDKHHHRIYSWSRAAGLAVVHDAPLDPVNLAVTNSGDLLVLSSAGRQGTVYTVRPGGPAEAVTVIEPTASAPRDNARVVLPINLWVDGQFANQLDFQTLEYRTLSEMFATEAGTPTAKQYVSPDGSLVLPAGRVFRQPANQSYPGIDESGWRWSHNLDAFGFITARPGERVYVVSSAENRTYRATVKPDGTLGDLEPFAERGGEGAVADADGNVYVLNGQIFVYDRSGNPAGRIDVPERPIGLVIGGPDRRTLFILTRHTLYGIAIRGAGESATPSK